MNKISKKNVEQFNHEQNTTPINIRRIERKFKAKYSKSYIWFN